MKALSIKQPWASLIAHGIKDIENRTWKTNFRGRIYIHASGIGYSNNDELFNIHQYKSFYYKKQDILETTNIKSAIIGEVDIVDCVINHPSIWAEKSYYAQTNESNPDCDDDRIVYNWVLANAVLYKEPILNVKGKLSFWEFNK